jgi:hypothetical protein
LLRELVDGLLPGLLEPGPGLDPEPEPKLGPVLPVLEPVLPRPDPPVLEPVLPGPVLPVEGDDVLGLEKLLPPLPVDGVVEPDGLEKLEPVDGLENELPDEPDDVSV